MYYSRIVISTFYLVNNYFRENLVPSYLLRSDPPKESHIIGIRVVNFETIHMAPKLADNRVETLEVDQQRLAEDMQESKEESTNLMWQIFQNMQQFQL